MSTTEALKHGTTLLADTTTHAVGELADKAKKQAHALASEAAERLAEHAEPPKPRRRGRTLLLGAALAGAVLGLVKLVRRSGLGRTVEDKVIDLTRGRTDEATLERLASEGLDPVGRGGF